MSTQQQQQQQHSVQTETDADISQQFYDTHYQFSATRQMAKAHLPAIISRPDIHPDIL